MTSPALWENRSHGVGVGVGVGLRTELKRKAESPTLHINNVATTAKTRPSRLQATGGGALKNLHKMAGNTKKAQREEKQRKSTWTRVSIAADFICYDYFDNVAASFDAHLQRFLTHTHTHTIQLQRYRLQCRYQRKSSLKRP